MKPLIMMMLVILAAGIMLTACAETLAPAPTLPAATPQPATTANLSAADVARGQQVYLDKQCTACHGPQAEGGIGPKMAGTAQPFDQFLHKIRTALPPKPAFSETELTTQDAYNIYGWLQSLKPGGEVVIEPTPTLPPGQVLGMQLWTEGQCDTCHGAFAQCSPQGPTLAGLNFPYEMERAKMRQTAATIPEHAAEHMRDPILQRLYQWLQAGAKPGDGC